MTLQNTIKNYGNAFDAATIYQVSKVLTASQTIEMVAAVTGKQIEVFEILMTADAACLMTVKSGTDVIAKFNMAANSSVVLQANNYDFPLFATTEAEALNITVGSGVSNAQAYIQYIAR